MAAADEASNYSKINERAEHEHMLPGYRALLLEQGTENEVDAARMRAEDPERSPSNLCAHPMDGCAGDARLYDWGERGFGMEQRFLFTARNGATLSARAWATRSGPAKRPGVVITTGSVQAPELFYQFAAQTLAKKGYVVISYDVQGQGFSDTRGEAPDEAEGVPFQQPANFVNGTEDALDFLLSTPARPYVPRPSDSSGTVHKPKQDRRVAEGRNAAFNPFHGLLDPDRIGIVGHSLGAFAVSKVASRDRRVDAVVAWDNLQTRGYAGSNSDEELPPRVPALGMSADYGLTPTPYGSPPDPQARNRASRDFSAAGVDTAQINVRGGTHYEWSYIPNPGFGATLRGMDMAAWYTGAWLDRYVKGDETADVRLLTSRWLSDKREAEVDPSGDGNMYSEYLRSRIDLRRADGSRVLCEDLRACDEVVAADCEPGEYSYLKEAQTPDGEEPATGSGCGGRTTSGRTCADRARPVSSFDRRAARTTRRRKLTLRGRASDRACGGRRGRVSRVVVSVARPERGGRCRYLQRGGRLGRRVACRRDIWLAAKGATRWSLRTPRKLPRGRYFARSRAVDRTGNVERSRRKRGTPRNRVRLLMR